MRLLKLMTAPLAALAGLAVAAQPATAQGTIKIGYTEALSGTFAQIGDQGLKTFQFLIDGINAKGGVLGRKLELVPYDNKAQPAEALVALQKIVDEGLSILLNCGPSNIAAALVEGVNKHNQRNKDRRIVYVNCGAVATELTNEKCSFWHFRTDAHVGMKSEIMVRGLSKSFTKVYMINQDYLFGQSVQADVKDFLKKLRPDVQIVGDELIPLGKVKDFSSYIAKIKAAGAEAVLTGNWGPDLALLVKASLEAGLPVEFYTMYAHLAGGPTAIGPAGNGKVHAIQNFSENVGVHIGNAELDAWVQSFRSKHDFDFSFGDRRLAIEMIAQGINKAGSTDAFKIASAMEGLKWKDGSGVEVTMRADDHQILMPYYVSTFATGTKYDSEKTGLGWKVGTIVKPEQINQPHSCKMSRPAS
jgi:branched-chain amino acid transport system substrate-binding protein